MQNLSRSLPLFFDVSGCIESVSGANICLIRWFYVIYMLVTLHQMDLWSHPFRSIWSCVDCSSAISGGESLDGAVSALNGLNVMGTAALQNFFERKSCYLGVLNKICLQPFFLRMNCKSRDEYNEFN